MTAESKTRNEDLQWSARDGYCECSCFGRNAFSYATSVALGFRNPDPIGPRPFSASMLFGQRALVIELIGDLLPFEEMVFHIFLGLLRKVLDHCLPQLASLRSIRRNGNGAASLRANETYVRIVKDVLSALAGHYCSI